jgi:hypothetical protein
MFEGPHVFVDRLLVLSRAGIGCGIGAQEGLGVGLVAGCEIGPVARVAIGRREKGHDKCDERCLDDAVHGYIPLGWRRS